MKLIDMLQEVKQHPDYHKAGMILCHNGVVRENTREGKSVTGLEVKVDRPVLEEIITRNKHLPGIIDILVHIEDNKPLGIGDDVMYIVVAGDIRENVIDALTKTLNEIKSKATSKTQFMATGQ
ncbi:MAG: molybdenum cofactor biosynthesis protein MoaE [Desulfobacteraceae bacterium]|nr:MAG: molybdenum cofactor biosynthesis protein MoaE [Desulfobacteraceae bacterium]